jgi:glucose dehydrogenase
MPRRSVAASCCAAIVIASMPGCSRELPPIAPAPAQGWPAYGGDPHGTRYSKLERINRGNVAHLEVAWTYRTGEIERRGDAGSRNPGRRFDRAAINLQYCFLILSDF